MASYILFTDDVLNEYNCFSLYHDAPFYNGDYWCRNLLHCIAIEQAKIFQDDLIEIVACNDDAVLFNYCFPTTEYNMQLKLFQITKKCINKSINMKLEAYPAIKDKLYSTGDKSIYYQSNNFLGIGDKMNKRNYLGDVWMQIRGSKTECFGQINIARNRRKEIVDDIIEEYAQEQEKQWRREAARRNIKYSTYIADKYLYQVNVDNLTKDEIYEINRLRKNYIKINMSAEQMNIVKFIYFKYSKYYNTTARLNEFNSIICKNLNIDTINRPIFKPHYETAWLIDPELKEYVPVGKKSAISSALTTKPRRYWRRRRWVS